MQEHQVLSAVKPGPCEPGKLYSQKELAPILGKSEAWFERSRWAGTGPTFTKVGRSPRYMGSAINAWLEAQARRNTGEGA